MRRALEQTAGPWGSRPHNALLQATQGPSVRERTVLSIATSHHCLFALSYWYRSCSAKVVKVTVQGWRALTVGGAGGVEEEEQAWDCPALNEDSAIPTPGQ